MIDLQELEKRLDLALSNESAESLTNWLHNQRKDNLENFLGIGCLKLFKGNPYVFTQGLLQNNYNIKSEINNNPSEQLNNAA